MGPDEARIPRPPFSIRGRLIDGPFRPVVARVPRPPFLIRVGRRRAREGDAGPVLIAGPVRPVVEEGVLVRLVVAERVDGGLDEVAVHGYAFLSQQIAQHVLRYL